MANYCSGASTPPFMAANVPPLLMLVMSKDHKNNYKAYNDYSDIDEDGTIDLQYKQSIRYYGYFDPDKCYSYSANTFAPSSVSSTSPATCSGQWSGNFLNWVTMSRMDVLRKVLYGGYRSTDTASSTILERQFLPQDAHSWVKVYTPGGSDPTISQLTPLTNHASVSFCNTTIGATTAGPSMRVADGSYPFWSSDERWQCARSNEVSGSRRPPAATGNYMDYTVRVQVCVSTLLGSERCQLYPSGNYKPIGLLQAYGENSKMYFGLMTGSWIKNKSGGVLRKNIGPITDEINYTTDGTFCINSNGVANTACVASTGVPGIIDTLNKMKIYRYTYGTNWGDGTYNTADNCSWGNQSFTESASGTCVNWGNPIGEIYYESLRYFMGLPKGASDTSLCTGATPAPSPTPTPTPSPAPTSAFDADDSSIVTGLTKVTWKDPYATYPYCAKPFIMAISDVSPSFDSDQLPGVNSNFGSAFTTDIKTNGSFINVSTLTDIVGGSTLGGENVTGNYFIGQSGTTNDTQSGVTTNLCTNKAVTSLSALRGICPTGPNFQGSYYMAGLAWWAHTTDLRSCNNTPQNALTGDSISQSVTTYSIAMSTNLPSLSIKLGSSNQYTVNFIPACYNSTIGNPCTLVHFIVDNNFSICTNPPTNAAGSYYINWEDSPQGGDYDMDADGCIYYVVNNAATPPTITFTVRMFGSSTPYDMNMGYIISGTTTDGPRYLASNCTSLLNSSSCGQWFTDYATGTTLTGGVNSLSFTHTVNTSASATKLLNDPLWYAAKWGGFVDSNGNNMPDLTSEWTTGVNGSGVPDTYFPVTNPSKLESSIEQAFIKILKQGSSGTAATVLSQRTQSGANILQVVFYPSKFFTGNTELSWVGYLNNLWFYNTKQAQEIREDTVNDFKLNLTNDDVIQFQTQNNNTSIQLYTDTTGCGTLSTPSGNATETFDTLNTIWEAGGNSRAPSGLNSTSTSYSGSFYDLYHTTAASRNVYVTNATGNGLELFNTTNSGDFSTYMGGASGTSTVAVGPSGTTINDIVDYVRGVDKAGLRNRTTANQGFSTLNVWKLGDIIYSTPLLQQYVPASNNGNADYYVTYVGANDGLLHAFKTGKLTSNALGTGEVEQLSGTNLGSELWGFIPRNSLPYLRYLADPSYSPNTGCHIYFNDLKPYIYSYTPAGSTLTKFVLIGGMRLGGACGCASSGTCPAGSEAYTPPSDTCSTANRTDTTSPMSRCVGLSSYFALDVTNPTAPTLLWEFSHPELGFSYSGPAVISRSGSLMVMFLSGPQTYTGYSYQNLKTFVLALNPDFTINTGASGSSGGVYKYDTGIPLAYGGRLFTNGVDVDGDKNTDYVIFGYTKAIDTTWTKFTGGLISVYTGGTTPPTSSGSACSGNPCSSPWSNCWNYNSSYFNLVGPVTSKVEVDKCFSTYYAFAGTGKFFKALDAYSVTNSTGSTTLSGDSLYSSPFNCDDNGCCTSTPASGTSECDICSSLLTSGSNPKGWTFPLDSGETVSSVNYITERNISDPTFPMGENLVFYSTTQPTSDVCSFGGRSRVVVFNCATGAAPAFGQDNCNSGCNCSCVSGNCICTGVCTCTGACTPTPGITCPSLGTGTWTCAGNGTVNGKLTCPATGTIADTSTGTCSVTATGTVTCSATATSDWSCTGPVASTTTNNYTIPVENMQGALFLQLSTSAINKISVSSGFHALTSSDTNQQSLKDNPLGAVTDWMQGITPESSTPYVPHSSSAFGKILHWMER
ncbi:MAG: hypothetical protein HQK89_12990 [Nitrospirae bacterium]|nr:hypothetical protein [Nitrospirota bacterium]